MNAGSSSHERRELGRRVVAFHRPAAEEVRVALRRRNVEAADWRRACLRRRVGLEALGGARPALVHAGVEVADLLRAVGDEVVVETGVVELDHVDRCRAGTGRERVMLLVAALNLRQIGGSEQRNRTSRGGEDKARNLGEVCRAWHQRRIVGRAADLHLAGEHRPDQRIGGSELEREAVITRRHPRREVDDDQLLPLLRHQIGVGVGRYRGEPGRDHQRPAQALAVVERARNACRVGRDLRDQRIDQHHEEQLGTPKSYRAFANSNAFLVKVDAILLADIDIEVYLAICRFRIGGDRDVVPIPGAGLGKLAQDYG